MLSNKRRRTTFCHVKGLCYNRFPMALETTEPAIAADDCGRLLPEIQRKLENLQCDNPFIWDYLRRNVAKIVGWIDTRPSQAPEHHTVANPKLDESPIGKRVFGIMTAVRTSTKNAFNVTDFENEQDEMFDIQVPSLSQRIEQFQETLETIPIATASHNLNEIYFPKGTLGFSVEDSKSYFERKLPEIPENNMVLMEHDRHTVKQAVENFANTMHQPLEKDQPWEFVHADLLTLSILLGNLESRLEAGEEHEAAALCLGRKKKPDELVAFVDAPIGHIRQKDLTLHLDLSTTVKRIEDLLRDLVLYVHSVSSRGNIDGRKLSIPATDYDVQHLIRSIHTKQYFEGIVVIPNSMRGLL